LEVFGEGFGLVLLQGEAAGIAGYGVNPGEGVTERLNRRGEFRKVGPSQHGVCSIASGRSAGVGGWSAAAPWLGCLAAGSRVPAAVPMLLLSYRPGHATRHASSAGMTPCYVAHPFSPGSRARNGRFPPGNPGKTARLYLVISYLKGLYFLLK